MATASGQPGGGQPPPLARPDHDSGGRPWVPANPAPLGLAGFGITTLALSMVNAHLVGTPVADTSAVLGLAIAYGGLAQLLAGMWEFRTGNTFGAVAFTSYGAFWISFYFLVHEDLAGLAKSGTAPSAVGLFLWAWAIFTGYMFLCSFASARSVSAVFLALTVTFVLLGIGWSGSSLTTILGGTSGAVKAGGYAGLVTAALALYTSCAEVMHAQYGRWVLPIGAPGQPGGAKAR
jgi:succinate-acetate transporter protein